MCVCVFFFVYIYIYICIYNPTLYLFSGQKYFSKLPCGKATCHGVDKTSPRKGGLLMCVILYTLQI